MNRKLTCKINGEDLFEPYKQLIGEKSVKEIKYFDKYVTYNGKKFKFNSYMGCLDTTKSDISIFQIIISIILLLAVIIGILITIYKMRQGDTEGTSETTTETITTSRVYTVIFKQSFFKHLYKQL